jgi:hypothetical protein
VVNDIVLLHKDVRRFWSKVRPDPKTGCWNWAGRCQSDKGQGRRSPDFDVRGKRVCSRRVAYLLAYGELPAHRIFSECRNHNCVSPYHLRPCPEVQAEAKRYSPARRPRRFSAKLARRIITLRAAGKSTVEIARRTGIGQSLVTYITRMGEYCQTGQLKKKGAA